MDCGNIDERIRDIKTGFEILMIRFEILIRGFDILMTGLEILMIGFAILIRGFEVLMTRLEILMSGLWDIDKWIVRY